MGTDSVRLFNKALADRILAMNSDEVVAFLTEHRATAKRQPAYVHSALLASLFARRQSATDVVARYVADGYSLGELKTGIALDLAFTGKEVALDYWGCYGEVFSDDTIESLSGRDYLPGETERWLQLLAIEHVDKIVASLRAHLHELERMTEADVNAVVAMRDYCAVTPDFMVAYLIDM